MSETTFQRDYEFTKLEAEEDKGLKLLRWESFCVKGKPLFTIVL